MNKENFNSAQHLDYEELIAYHQGNLSNREMHRLELHLIDCKLCVEALEGLANVDEAKLLNHLTSIRTKTKLHPNKTLTNKHWLAIAASIVLITAISIVFFNLPAEQDLMIAEQLPTKEELVEEVVIDSNTLNNNADTTFTAKIEEEHQVADIEISEPQQTLEIASEPEVKEVQNVIVEKETDLAFIAPPQEGSAIIDQALADEAALAEMIITDKVEEEQAAARSKKIAAPLAGAETPNLNEVADSKTNRNAEYKADAEYKVAAPVKGMRSFYRYISRKLKYPNTAKENSIEGEVVLELTIDADGTLSNISVQQSLGYGCDQEAIRLTRDGPKWIPASRNDVAIIDKVIITIPFKL